MRLLPLGVTPLGCAIEHVRVGVAEEEVVRPHARWRVAPMKYVSPIRDRAHVQLVADPVGSMVLPVEPEAAVAFLVSRREPEPAPRNRVQLNLRLEARLVGHLVLLVLTSP